MPTTATQHLVGDRPPDAGVQLDQQRVFDGPDAAIESRDEDAITKSCDASDFPNEVKLTSRAYAQLGGHFWIIERV